MPQFRVVSVDMFQTLVDIRSRVPAIWSRILGDAYTPDLAGRYAAMLLGLAVPRFSAPDDGRGFRTARSVFADCFAELFAAAGLNCDSAAAARVFVEEHGRAAKYDDTDAFLSAVSAEYPVCLTSDADVDMVAPHLARFRFDRVFISERLQSYKGEPDCRMFASLLDHYRVRPEQVIHIGDSYADVFGAGQYGITTCWLNRTGQAWEHEVRPDFTVASLRELPALLVTAGQRAGD